MTKKSDVTTIPLKDLRLWPDNPRRSVDEDGIGQLKASIQANGILQPLLVRPVPLSPGKAEVIAGQRRFKALKALYADGALPADHPIPCTLRIMDDAEATELALTENTEREDMTQLDEADAYMVLVEKNVRLSEIAARFGVSVRTVERRLTLANLIAELRERVADGRLALDAAQAVSVFDAKRQRTFLDAFRGGESWTASASGIRTRFLDGQIPLASALFDPAEYQGAVIRDLFGSDDDSFFADTEAFWHLQNGAIENELVPKLKERGWREVRVVQEPVQWYRYQECADKATGSALIEVHANGQVEVYEGYVERSTVTEDETPTARPQAPASPRTGNKPASRKKPGPASGVLADILNGELALEVQGALAGNQRLALEYAIAAMLSGRGRIRADAYRFPRPDEELTGAARDVVSGALNETHKLVKGEPGKEVSRHDLRVRDAADLMRRLAGLDDENLARVFRTVVALSAGPEATAAIAGDSDLCVATAKRAGLSPRERWTPGESYLKRLTLAQLRDLARDCYGDTVPEVFNAGRKAEVVSELAVAFACASAGDGPVAPDVADRLNAWLPPEWRGLSEAHIPEPEPEQDPTPPEPDAPAFLRAAGDGIDDTL